MLTSVEDARWLGLPDLHNNLAHWDLKNSPESGPKGSYPALYDLRFNCTIMPIAAKYIYKHLQLQDLKLQTYNLCKCSLCLSFLWFFQFKSSSFYCHFEHI